MQDIEFTIQRRQALDAADAQRQAHRTRFGPIAVDMAKERLITRRRRRSARRRRLSISCCTPVFDPKRGDRHQERSIAARASRLDPAPPPAASSSPPTTRRRTEGGGEQVDSRAHRDVARGHRRHARRRGHPDGARRHDLARGRRRPRHGQVLRRRLRRPRRSTTRNARCGRERQARSRQGDSISLDGSTRRRSSPVEVKTTPSERSPESSSQEARRSEEATIRALLSWADKFTAISRCAPTRISPQDAKSGHRLRRGRHRPLPHRAHVLRRERRSCTCAR